MIFKENKNIQNVLLAEFIKEKQMKNQNSLIPEMQGTHFKNVK